MEISELGKKILKSIGPAEIAFSSLIKKVKDEGVGSELPLLQSLKLLDDIDGYITLTDLGIKVAALDDNEIPDSMLQENSNSQKFQIHKPGDLSSRRTNTQSRSPRLPNKIKTKPPIAEPAKEGESPNPESVIQMISGLRNCPVFGKANTKFCVTFCLAWSAESDGCSLNDKTAERVKI